MLNVMADTWTLLLIDAGYMQEVTDGGARI